VSKVQTRQRKLRLPKSMVLKVGVMRPGEQHNEQGTTVGQIAAAHEFGLGNVPQRSFVRRWFDEEEQAFSRLAAGLMAQGFAGGFAGLRQALELAGVKAAAGIKNFITEGRATPAITNPRTIASKERRGFFPPYTPLVETGALRNSIDSEVEVK